MKKLKSDLTILFRGYKIIFGIEPSLVPLISVSAILEALFPFILIYTSSEMLNALSRGDEAKSIFVILAISLALNILTQQAKQIITRKINVKNQLFERKFNMYLNEKILDMDYGSIENPEIHLKRRRIDDIRNASGGGIWKLVYQSGDVIRNLAIVFTSIALTYKAFTIHGTIGQDRLITLIVSPVSSILLLLFIVANTFITMFSNSVNAKKNFKLNDSTIPFNRKFFYVMDNYINGYNAGKDIRLYNQKKMILENFERLHSSILPIFSKLEKNNINCSNLNSTTSSIISLLVYIFIGLKALYKLIDLGDLYKYINGIVKFSEGLNGFLNSFNELRINNEYLAVLYEFLDLPNAMYQGSLPVEKRDDNEYEIEFKNVSFKYPGAETFALRNFNLKLNIGKRLAVVGMNGSGKSTMIKLLCRLYDPTEGEITLNAVDIKKYRYNEYMNIFSVVFQDFKLFSFSLGQNVAASTAMDERQAEYCLNKAGLSEFLSARPRGLDTPLYKDFEEDGIEISGGEAQKIALARALYKNAPFIVLDEPTAALDPIAEFEIYSKFNEIVGDKTAIYISHRLSSCRFCDDIAVFNEGELVQRGSHNTLIADEKGKYYELWNAQAQYYIPSLLHIDQAPIAQPG